MELKRRRREMVLAMRCAGGAGSSSVELQLLVRVKSELRRNRPGRLGIGTQEKVGSPQRCRVHFSLRSPPAPGHRPSSPSILTGGHTMNTSTTVTTVNMLRAASRSARASSSSRALSTAAKSARTSLRPHPVVIGPTQLNRYQEHYRTTLASDLLYMTYDAAVNLDAETDRKSVV